MEGTIARVVGWYFLFMSSINLLNRPPCICLTLWRLALVLLGADPANHKYSVYYGLRRLCSWGALGIACGQKLFRMICSGETLLSLSAPNSAGRNKYF
jgi:hypothetical protein